MSEQPTLVNEIWKVLENSPAVRAAALGAAGGLTSGLSITGQTRRAVARQILIGAIMASGLGSLSAALMSAWLGLPALAVGAGSGASYLVGVFGPALVEVMLSRIRAGRLPND